MPVEPPPLPAATRDAAPAAARGPRCPPPAAARVPATGLALLVALAAQAGALSGPRASGEDEDAPAIHEIQGRSHVSPWRGREVAGVVGLVTSVRERAFTMQTPDGGQDDDPATSEGLFVWVGARPGVTVGDLVAVDGRVVERRSPREAELSRTQIEAGTVAIVSRGHPLPRPVVLGAAGRAVPDRVVDDDSEGDVESGPTTFDPGRDGLDWFEALEAMRVRVDGARAVGPTSRFGELPVVADGGRGASGLNARGGLTITEEDRHPERLILDDLLVPLPRVPVGTRLLGPVVAVVGYSYGAYKLEVTACPAWEAPALALTRAPEPGPGQIAVATLNVENLSPRSEPARVAALARQIVEHLRAPDLLALQEVQDDNGPLDDDVVTATRTLAMLVEAIVAAGGPRYRAADVPPVDDEDGGQPGGNIRCALLWRTDRGLSLPARPGATSTSAATLEPTPLGPALVHNPSRIAPASPAFAGGRKPLVAELHHEGRPLFVVDCHFKSKRGDDPLFGRRQPPVRATEAVRAAQARVVAAFVDELLALDAGAQIVVLGDLNDFQFSDAVRALAGGRLHVLTDRLPPGERYTYVYGGNAQALDHVLVSDALADGASLHPVRVNAEYAERASDHDPCVALLDPR